jgi:hypothetical protein
MGYDVSGFGFQVRIIASNTFPSGFTISAFSDDADPMDVPEITITDVATGVNGDLISWSKASPTMVKFAVIDGSPDDVNLQILFNANRVGRGLAPAADIITATAVYPDGNTYGYLNGKITKGMPTSSVASSGRIKTKTYEFAFESTAGNGG